MVRPVDRSELMDRVYFEYMFETLYYSFIAAPIGCVIALTTKRPNYMRWIGLTTGFGSGYAFYLA